MEKQIDYFFFARTSTASQMLNPLGQKVEQPSTKLSVAGSILMMEPGGEGEGGGDEGAGAGAGAAVAASSFFSSAAGGASGALGSSGFSGTGSRGNLAAFWRGFEGACFKKKN